MKARRWGASGGLAEWLWQRASAIVVALLLPLPVWLLAKVAGGISQQAFLQLVDTLAVRVAHTLLALAVLVHAWVGVKVILDDYLHRIGWRALALLAWTVAVVTLGIWWLAVVWAWVG